uniref:Uncharacterized protein n=1 Tax=Paracidobacterium acidisoli TaxID=2303751 RepID=A0A372ILL6_9BACT
MCALQLHAQDADTDTTHAGYAPVLSGDVDYIYNVNGGIPTLLPQINPLLLLPLGSHLLVESRTEFTGFFERRNGTSGDYTGEIFKTVDYAQLDWLANTHATVVAGKYILPFGLVSERLEPVWIRNFQDLPIDYSIGTRTSGAGEGGMLRGVIAQTNSASVQYSAYYSAHSGVNQLQASRTLGEDVSVYFPNRHIELGTSYQRFREGHHSNNETAYLSWQPLQAPFDLKAQYDRSFTGQGFWIDGAYMLSQVPVANAFMKNVQLAMRVQDFHPLHGGGSGVPNIETQRVDFGVNYYLKSNWRIISSYGRQFTSKQDANIWNTGFTYRFTWPLWPEKKVR